MGYFVLLLLMILVYSSKAAPAGTFKEDYLEKEAVVGIKGVFTILILLSHASQYIALSGYSDEIYRQLQGHLSQMVVAMFLFYSGYGMMESIKKKGSSYVMAIPGRRLLKVLINFDLALCLFMVTNLIIGKHYDGKTILLSLFGWSGIGNSNWYIFVILVLYILMFFSFLPLKWKSGNGTLYLGAVIFTVLSIGFVYVQMKVGRPTWYYNTLILFALGMWYSLLRKKIEMIVMRNEVMYLLGCMIVLCVYFISFQNRSKYGIEGYTVWGIAFTSAVVLFTMKVSIKGEFLDWFGRHVFSIYILQRIPMNILSHIGFAESHKYWFVIFSIITTMFLASIFEICINKLWKTLTRFICL